MTDNTTELPVFPTTVPALFCDPDVTSVLFADVLDQLSPLVEVDEANLTCATPCAGYNVRELRQHVVGWLGFFAAALRDPAATSARPDPEATVVADASSAGESVRHAAAVIQQAIADNAAGQMVTMTSSRMAGDAVLAMALGEYIIHAWDLATAVGASYQPPAAAIAPAHEFLRGMVAPEYRGPDSGFFDAEVTVADDASELDRLLGFAGRNPGWTP